MYLGVRLRARVRVCAGVCVRAGVRVRTCVCVYVRAYEIYNVRARAMYFVIT